MMIYNSYLWIKPLDVLDEPLAMAMVVRHIHNLEGYVAYCAVAEKRVLEEDGI